MIATLPLLLSLGAPAEPPRLLVLLSVDQCVPRQLERLEPWLDGGLGRFLRDGTVYFGAELPYAASETGPGHATLATGLLPARHGIVGNMYRDRALGRVMYCVGDESARTVTGEGTRGGAGVSCANLLAPTLGDRLLDVFPGARVVSVAGKDRSAILMGGRAASAALWWDRFGAGFVGSSACGDALPDFVREWNAQWVERAAGWTWEPTFPGDPQQVGTAPDERPGEAGLLGRTTFPYTLPRGADGEATALGQLASTALSTPLVDLFCVELATAAVDAYGLGRDEQPDVLALGLSCCDIVGHGFGPFSYETTDLLLRADDALGALFTHLDETVGEGRWVAALTSDHGVLPLPESLAAEGIGAGRVGLGEIGKLRKDVVEALGRSYPETPLTVGFDGFEFTLDEAGLSAAGLEAAEVRAAIARAAVAAPWVAAAYTLEDLQGTATEDAWLSAYRKSFRPERSGDVVVRAQPWTIVGVGRGTSHGSVYPYDRRIPLAFLGAPFAARRDWGPASSLDIAPTFLRLCGVEVAAGELDGEARVD